MCLYVYNVDIRWLNDYAIELVFGVRLTPEDSYFVLDGSVDSVTKTDAASP